MRACPGPVEYLSMPIEARPSRKILHARRSRVRLRLASAGEQPPALLRDDAHWLLVQRIVASDGFRRSRLLSAFLLDVCERQLLGRPDEITEQQVGVRVFGRPVDYDPGQDNIVRKYARLVRRRLADFFMTEGAMERTRIEIPRGTYRPRFTPTGAARFVLPAMHILPPAPVAVGSAALVTGCEVAVLALPERWKLSFAYSNPCTRQPGTRSSAGLMGFSGTVG